MSMMVSGSGSVPQVALDRSSEVLDSWKAIASYLGRTVRTSQRWHRHEGMPVHHHLHRTATTVYALRDELDQWRVSRSQTNLATSAAERAREEIREQNHFIATVPSSYFRSVVSLLPEFYLLRPNPFFASLAVLDIRHDAKPFGYISVISPEWQASVQMPSILPVRSAKTNLAFMRLAACDGSAPSVFVPLEIIGVNRSSPS